MSPCTVQSLLPRIYTRCACIVSPLWCGSGADGFICSQCVCLHWLCVRCIFGSAQLRWSVALWAEICLRPVLKKHSNSAQNRLCVMECQAQKRNPSGLFSQLQKKSVLKAYHILLLHRPQQQYPSLSKETTNHQKHIQLITIAITITIYALWRWRYIRCTYKVCIKPL